MITSMRILNFRGSTLFMTLGGNHEVYKVHGNYSRYIDPDVRADLIYAERCCPQSEFSLGEMTRISTTTMEVDLIAPFAIPNLNEKTGFLGGPLFERTA